MGQYSRLTIDPIPKLIRSISIPASIGFFFNTMFNVVDTFFAGVISTQALAALSLSFPVFFIILSLGSGISTGTTALIATALGEGDLPKARMFAIQGIAFGVLLSMAVTAIGIAASPPLFSLLGAKGEYLDMCLVYMNTIFLGSVFFILNFMLNSILNAQGDTRSFRNFLIVGCFFNIILDPWFIYGGLGVPAMGVRGVAVATVVIELIGNLYLGYKVLLTDLACGRCFSEAIPRMNAFREIAQQGFPTSLNSITVGVGIFVITYFISIFGKEAVAAYGVATRVEQIMDIAELFIESLKKGGKVILFGNGGSASDSQHIAAELVGRFKKDRTALPAIGPTRALVDSRSSPPVSRIWQSPTPTNSSAMIVELVTTTMPDLW